MHKSFIPHCLRLNIVSIKQFYPPLQKYDQTFDIQKIEFKIPFVIFTIRKRKKPNMDS